MDQLDGVLGPFAVAAAAAAAVAEAEAEAEPAHVDVVAAKVPRLVVSVWRSPQCCQLAVLTRCGRQ